MANSPAKILLAEMSRNLHEGPAQSAMMLIHNLHPDRYLAVPVFSLGEDDHKEIEKQLGTRMYNVLMPRPRIQADPLAIAKFTKDSADAVKSLVKIARKEHAELIHANSIINLHAALAASRLGLPLFLFVREILPEKLINRIYMKWVCGQAAIVAAVSGAVRDKLADAGADPGRIHVVYNGIDVNDVSDQRKLQLRRGLGIAPDAPVVGIVGTVTELKGHHVLFKAAHGLLEKFPKIRIVIVGEPQADSVEYMDKLKEDAETMGMTGNVIFTGRRADARDLMGMFDVYAQPSVRDDSLPRTVLEAMSAGTAVVASRIGGIPEMVVHETTGLLVPPDDAEALAVAIEQLLENPEKRKEMGREAKAHAGREFDLETQTDKVMALYDEVLGRR